MEKEQSTSATAGTADIQRFQQAARKEWLENRIASLKPNIMRQLATLQSLEKELRYIVSLEDSER